MRLPRTRLVAAATAVVAVAGIPAEAPARAQVVPLITEAAVVDFAPPLSAATYPVTDARTGRTTTARWRVVNGTGNCCETLLTSSPDGRLYDYGGSFVHYSDDDGRTWKRVKPLTPLVNGEGAIVQVGNGDVLGVSWDPYSGDHLQAVKYDAAQDTWLVNELPLHSPFYDREWVAVVPGPLEYGGETVPYLSFIKGAYPSKEVWFVSGDGIRYDQVTSKVIDRTFAETVQAPLPIAADAGFDYNQPVSETGITPLGGGRALAAPDWPDLDGTWALFDPSTLTWSGYRYPDGSSPEGRVQIDSLGRIHEVIGDLDSGAATAFTYRTSDDGGRTWTTRDVTIPGGRVLEQLDLRVNAAAGVSAVSIRAQDVDGNDQDLAFKFDVTELAPRLLRTYEIGFGDVGATAGVGNSVRMDFASVAILPDGRLAVSFLDSTTGGANALTGRPQTKPAVAIELPATRGNPRVR